MKMKIALVTLIGVPFLLLSCKKQESKSFTEYAIQGKVYDTEILARYPSVKFCMDSVLVVYANNTLGKLITVYSLKDEMKEVASYGSRGRGPGEYYALELNSAHGNRLFGRNMNMQELVVLEVANDSGRIEIKEVERLDNKRILQNDIPNETSLVSYLDEDHFMGLSFGGPGQFFSLYDNKMNWLSYFGDPPIPEEIHPSSYRMQLSGSLATDNGDFVFSPRNLPKVVYYSGGRGADVPQKQWEDTFYDSNYNVSNRQISFGSRTVGNVLGVTMGKKYIYILFLDIPLADYSVEKTETYAANIIFVYDRKGNRIARLNLDNRIYNFCVSADERTLYGMAPTPEARLAEFGLPLR
jgi:hypothetical protein